MPRQFERAGISLTYPDNWLVEDEWEEEGGTIVFRSPETAFFLLAVRPDIDDPSDLADIVLESMRADYPTLEAEAVVDSVAGQPAVGHDIEFIALDFTNTARSRCVLAGQGAILFLAQLSDIDPPQLDAVLRAMQQSIRIDDE